MSTTTEAFPERLSYRFPDPTDPTLFQPMQESSSSSSHPWLHQSSTHESNSDQSKLSPHQLTPSSHSQSIQHSSPNRTSLTPSLSASLIDSSHHQQETDWSILSLKNQPVQQPISSHQPVQIPLILPTNHPSTSPIHQNDHHPLDPHPSTPPTSHPSHLLPLHPPDQTSKCQLWLESLTDTSEFSYQVSERLDPSSADQLHVSCHHAFESRPDGHASQPTNQDLNRSTTLPENKVSTANPLEKSIDPLLECFLDPSMDLSSSYLEPDQLAKPKSITSDPPKIKLGCPPLEPSSPIDSQVLPSKLNHSSSSQFHPKAQNNFDRNPSSSNASHGRVPSSPNIPADPKDSRHLFSFNRWTLLFNLIWPISLACFIYPKYWKPLPSQKSVHDSTEQNSLELFPDPSRVPLSQFSDEDDSDDLMQLVESFPGLEHQNLVPELDSILNEQPLIEKQEEKVLVLDSQVSSFQQPNHQISHQQDRSPIGDTDPPLQLSPANDLDKIRQIVHSSEISPGYDSKSEITRRDHEQDPISVPRGPDVDPRVIEPFDPASAPLTNQPLPQTPQVHTAQLPSSTAAPAAVFLLAGFLIIARSFLLHRKSNGGSRTEITAEQLTSKLDSSSLPGKNVANLRNLAQISMDHIQSTKMIKNLENRIRVSKNIPRVELGLLAWLKQQIGDDDGSEKLWWRFWSDEDESQRFDIDVELARDSSGLLKLLIEYYSQCSDSPILPSKLEEMKVSISKPKVDEIVNVKLEQVETPPTVQQQVKGSKSSTKKKSDTSNTKDNSKRNKLVKSEEALEMKKQKQFKASKLSRPDIKNEGVDEDEGSDGDQSDRTLLPEKPSPVKQQKKKLSARKSTPINSEQLVLPPIDSTKNLSEKNRKQRQSEPIPRPSLASSLSNLKPFDPVESPATRRSSARLKKS